MTARTASKTPSSVSSNLVWGGLTFPQAPVMAPSAPVKEPKTAPSPTREPAPAPTREPAPPQRDPVHPGERPDPGESPSPACPPSTCPAP